MPHPHTQDLAKAKSRNVYQQSGAMDRFGQLEDHKGEFKTFD
ncbi:hypothetical protein LEMLEM_LOCUS23115, partial [Lemmus lemmus]